MIIQSITVHHANDDADTLLVKTTMNLIKEVNPSHPVVVVAQDTDILVLLCYHRPWNCTNLFLQTSFDGLYDIVSINVENREQFLFKYGWSGNDTVSRTATQNVPSLNLSSLTV